MPPRPRRGASWTATWINSIRPDPVAVSERVLGLFRHSAETVPVYRELLESHGIVPDRVRSSKISVVCR